MHYWLVNMRGGEKVVQSIARMYPEAVLYTHAVDKACLPNDLCDRDIRTSFIQRLPLATKYYQKYLPFMPLALEELDLREYDLVISSESGPAKGVIVGPATTHVCYCHSPMRYVWDMYHDYMSHVSLPVRLFMSPLSHYLRAWDHTSASRVDTFVANSRYVKERIRKFYGREAVVIAPPVSVDDFAPNDTKDDFYLFFGELVRYKRADLAVEAFRQSGRKLIIAGKGEQLEHLKKIAPSNVSFTGSIPFSEVKRLLARTRGLIFPGVEDFGIVPVEAMASGTPVIAFKKGGALDSVVDGRTGLFFETPSPEALNEAIDRLEKGDHQINLAALREQAERFRKEHFESKFRTVVDQAISERRSRLSI